MQLELIKSNKKPKIIGLADDEEKKQRKSKIISEASESENKNDSIKKLFTDSNNEHKYEPTSATGAFFRSAGRSTPELVSNVLNKTGETGGSFFDLINKKLHPEDYDQSGILKGERTNLVPESLKEKTDDRSHPIASLLGGIVGSAPLMGGTIGAARSALPAWNAIAKNAIGSVGRRAGVGAVEGAGLGALYSKPGEELKEGTTGGILGAAGYAIIPSLIKAIKSAPEKFRNIRDIDKLRAELEANGLNKEQADSAINMAMSEAHKEFGSKSIEGLEHQLNNRMSVSERISNELQQANSPVSETAIPQFKSLESPQPPTMERPPIFEEMVPIIKSILEEHTKKSNETEKNISKNLGEGQIFHERFATVVKEKRNALENTNDENYFKVDEELDKHPVNLEVQDTKKLKFVIKEAKDAIKEYKLSGESADNLMKIVTESASSIKSMSSKELLNLYRKTRNTAFDSLMTSKMNPHTDIGERAYSAYKNLQKTSNNMYELLKNSIPKEAFEKLEEAQAFFKENIAPMRKNSTFNEIKKKGKVSGNLMEKSIGAEEGQEILQKMIADDPELKRLVVGQSFAHNPNSLNKPNEALEKHFLPGMPWLQELLAQHKGINEAIGKTKHKLELAEIHDKSQQELINKILEQNLKLQQEHVAKLKEHEKAKIKREEALTKQTKQRIDKTIKLKQTLKAHENKIAGLEKTVKQLKDLKKNQTAATDTYKKTEQKLNDTEKEISKLKKRAVTTSILITSALGTTAAIKSLIK